MTLTIGRCTDLRPAPRSPSRQGDRVVVRGTIIGTSAADLQARRQQLLGLEGDADDPVVPMTWSTDSTLDGFYRVLAVSVEQIGPSSSARAAFSVTLEPIPGNTAPLVELDASAVVRTNSVGMTSGEPSAISQVTHVSASTYDNVSLFRTSEDGAVYYKLDAAPFTSVSSAFPSIANYYSGMCKLEVQYGGAWYDVVGQQAPASAAGLWRISNGLVRFTYSSYTGVADDRGGLLVEVYDSSAWRTTVTMKLGVWDGAAFDDSQPFAGIGDSLSPAGAAAAAPVRVLRNSPETVTIGFYKERTATQFVSLNAGAMFCTVTTRTSASLEPMMRPVASEVAAGLGTSGGFTIDPGVQRSSNDANGNRYVILYSASAGPFNQNGGLRHGSSVSGGTMVSFGVGVVLGGSSAVTGDTGLELAEQYIGQAAWRQRVVVR